MTYFSGQHGQIYVKPESSNSSLMQVGSLKNWSLNMQLAVLDTTALGSTDRTLINGVRSYTGSASMLYYQEDSSNVRRIIQTSFFASSKTDPDAADFMCGALSFSSRLKPKLKFNNCFIDFVMN